MFGFPTRAQVAGKVSSTLDGLVSRLRYMFDAEHDVNGHHKGITYTGPITNITVVNGIVTKVS